MSEFKDRCFQDAAGTIPAEVGDKVGLIINNPPPLTANKFVFYTIVFNYCGSGQRYLADDKELGLCFVDADSDYRLDDLKIFNSYERAKEVMDELSKNSFPNEGVLQVCSLELNAIGEPSKGYLSSHMNAMKVTDDADRFAMGTPSVGHAGEENNK